MPVHDAVEAGEYVGFDENIDVSFRVFSLWYLFLNHIEPSIKDIRDEAHNQRCVSRSRNRQAFDIKHKKRT